MARDELAGEMLPKAWFTLGLPGRQGRPERPKRQRTQTQDFLSFGSPPQDPNDQKDPARSQPNIGRYVKLLLVNPVHGKFTSQRGFAAKRQKKSVFVRKRERREMWNDARKKNFFFFGRVN